jgi:hypothetical protein
MKVYRRCPRDHCYARPSGTIRVDGDLVYVCRDGHETVVPVDFFEMEEGVLNE